MVTINCENRGAFSNIRLVVNPVRSGGFTYAISFVGGSGSPVRGTIGPATDLFNLVSLLSNSIRGLTLPPDVKSSVLTGLSANRSSLNSLPVTARPTTPSPTPQQQPVVPPTRPVPTPRVVNPSPTPTVATPPIRSAPVTTQQPAPRRPATDPNPRTLPIPAPTAPIRVTEITDPLSNSARLSAFADEFTQNPQRNFNQLNANSSNFIADLQNPRGRLNLLNIILSTTQGSLYLGSPRAQIPTDLGNPSLDSLKSFVSAFLRNSQNIPSNARAAVAQVLPQSSSVSDSSLLLASFIFLCATRNSSFTSFPTSLTVAAQQNTPVVTPTIVTPPVIAPTAQPQTLDPIATQILAGTNSGNLTSDSLNRIRNYSAISDLLMQRVYESLQTPNHPLSSNLRSFRRTHADSPSSLGEFVRSLAQSNTRFQADLQALAVNVLHLEPTFFSDGSFLRHESSTKYTLMALSIASWRFTQTNIQTNDRPWVQLTQRTTSDAGVQPPRIAW